MELARTGKAKRLHLNAEDCDQLGRGASGAGGGVLRQPQPLPGTPARRLQPRTPTKKRKLESPSKQQRSIDDFYQVTGVVSSSPQKASQQPSSSSYSSSSGGGGTTTSTTTTPPPPPPPPLAGSRAERRRSVDHDDDVSLLAALAEEHPEMEKKEEEEEEEEVEEIDYLEGITSEMFDDTSFECRDSTNQRTGGRDLEKGDEEWEEDLEEEEEEVEPLPDAHYGLLGSSDRGLRVPRGGMEDLPEEVVRQVLLLLPAQDLYRSVALVCHAWRAIVQDPKFVPYKKQYFRYMMGETGTVAQVKSTLEDGGVLDPSLPQESVRRLVLLMSQHAPGERLRPEDLLRCVGRHRLFPVVQSCLDRRFPDLQQLGPSPYAAMALVLVLGEAVTDVQALVALALGAMSRRGVVEFLSHAATLLLAAAHHQVKISSRIHYNIFYVLYLMHSGSTSVTTGPNGERHRLTQEQQQILSHHILPHHVVKVMAFAGTGKTSTLVRYAEERPGLRFLYVAFNRSVAAEALRRFPGNVDCKTVHSIAYGDVGKRSRRSPDHAPEHTQAAAAAAAAAAHAHARTRARARTRTHTQTHFMSQSSRHIVEPRHVHVRLTNVPTYSVFHRNVGDCGGGGGGALI